MSGLLRGLAQKLGQKLKEKGRQKTELWDKINGTMTNENVYKYNPPLTESSPNGRPLENPSVNGFVPEEINKAKTIGIVAVVCLVLYFLFRKR